jgi:retron-type reverse transcriptase
MDTLPRERERGLWPLIHIFDNIISFENLLKAWREFLCGKKKRKDVIFFSVNLLDNILSLHNDLKNKTYRHSDYSAFKINDPKPRDIHKANVRDRLLHHAIYIILYPYFDKKFIFDSFSCRDRKGVHRAVDRLRKFVRIVSKNNTKATWVLKCDIRKFFASIDHGVLLNIFRNKIKDKDVIWLLEEVVKSFCTKDKVGKGLPLGNLTSQLFVNIYMNEFDQFVKRDLKVRYYIRYADDFVVLSENKEFLEKVLLKVPDFLETKLCLSLNRDKTFIKTFSSGVDFLGWVNFFNRRTLRTSTKRRMFKKIKNNSTREILASYHGLLRHGNTYKIIKNLKVVENATFWE